MLTRLEAIKQLTAAGTPMEIAETQALGLKVRVFKNAPSTLRDIYHDTRNDQPFLVYEDERLTFEQTWRRACTLASALVEDYGVRKGDRVALSMRNYPEWMIAFSAITSIGAVAVALNSLWQLHELEFGLSDCGPKVLIADYERVERLEACANVPDGMAVICVRAAKPLPSGVRRYEDVMARAETDVMPPVELGSDDEAIMLYTSGSSGNPKGVVSTHRNIINALLSWELDLQIGVLRGILPAPLPDAPQNATLLGIPLFHVTGMHVVYLSSYRTHRRVVTMYKWNAVKAAEIIERERITHFTGPAAVTGDLVEVARRGGKDLSSLVSVGGGGAARPPEQVRAISEAFGNARPSTGWGMTETNAIGVGTGSSDYLEHPASSGQVSAVLDIRIVDPEGKVLPTMERGELQIRGSSVMRGYWKRPDANAESFNGEWFRTGDVAYIDEDGFVYIVDRIKDMVIRGGENIGCGAVEAALTEHPAIIEACVYGVPDPRLGEEVAASLYASGPVEISELRAFLEPRLARFQIPRYFHLHKEPLPRIASGKILKRQLRAEAVDRLASEKALAGK